MYDTFLKVTTRTPGGVVVAAVIQGGVVPPDAATRARIIDTMRTNTAENRGIAYVIEETGFLAAAMRSVVTGTLLVVRPPYPSRVFASFADAAPWLLTHAGGSAADVPALTAAFDSLRRQYHMPA